MARLIANSGTLSFNWQDPLLVEGDKSSNLFRSATLQIFQIFLFVVSQSVTIHCSRLILEFIDGASLQCIF